MSYQKIIHESIQTLSLVLNSCCFLPEFYLFNAAEVISFSFEWLEMGYIQVHFNLLIKFQTYIHVLVNKCNSILRFP